jgi:predicted MFS family arabinose efflux permease
VIVASFVLMVPVVFVAEKYRAHRGTLLGAITGLIVVLGLMHWGMGSFDVMVVLLTCFFVMFNVLEALQPSLVSRVAPSGYKGLALGFYNTSQAAGLFWGGGLGGVLAAQAGSGVVFWVVAGLAVVWLMLSWGLKPLV